MQSDVEVYVRVSLCLDVDLLTSTQLNVGRRLDIDIIATFLSTERSQVQEKCHCTFREGSTGKTSTDLNLYHMIVIGRHVVILETRVELV